MTTHTPKDLRTSLVAWLNYVITTLNIHKRTEWGHVLGVTPQAIGTWLSGDKLPRPEALRDLIVILHQRYEARAKSALAAWKILADRPLGEVWPGDTRTDAPTLGHYVVAPLWDDFRLAIESQPAAVQADLLEQFIAEVNRRRLGAHREPVAMPSDQTIREVASTAIPAQPDLMNLIHWGIKNKRLLDFSNLPRN